MFMDSVLGILCAIFIGNLIHAEKQCPVHWIKVGDFCYRTRYNYAVKDWNDGRYWCEIQGGNLARFSNLREMDSVISYQNLLADRVPFWIGLHRYHNRWAWTDNSKVNQSIVDVLRANTIGHDCVEILTTGITVGNCTEKKGVLCQRSLEKPVRCNSFDDWQMYGDKCYKVTRTRGRWDTAKYICSAFKASIASPQTTEEQFALYDYVQNTGQPIWIGLTSLRGNPNGWLWSDGTALNMTFWEKDKSIIGLQNRKICSYIDPGAANWSASWMPAMCEVESGKIICEKPAVKIPKALVQIDNISTWYEAEQFCNNSGGYLATETEAYGYVDVWIAQNTSVVMETTTVTTTTVRRSGDDDEENDLVDALSGVCPYISISGLAEASCTDKKAFVCSNISDYLVIEPQKDPPTSSAVVAVAILLVLLVIVAVILLIVWFRRRKRKDKLEEENDDEVIKNGAANIQPTKLENNSDNSKEMNASSRNSTVSLDSTYDHTTTIQTVSGNGHAQTIYDHCTETPGDTYDHTGNTGHNGTNNIEGYGIHGQMN